MDLKTSAGNFYRVSDPVQSPGLENIRYFIYTAVCVRKRPRVWKEKPLFLHGRFYASLSAGSAEYPSFFRVDYPKRELYVDDCGRSVCADAPCEDMRRIEIVPKRGF